LLSYPDSLYRAQYLRELAPSVCTCILAFAQTKARSRIELRLRCVVSARYDYNSAGWVYLNMPATKNPPFGERRELPKVNAEIVVIVNPVSCSNGVDAFETQAALLLKPYGHQVQFERTTESVGAMVLARRAIDDGAALVIAAGGDGTVMETINASVGTQIPVGIVPLGTGNMLASNLNLPMDLPEAFDVAVNGISTAIDLVQINESSRHFAIMGGIGFDAHIMHDTARADKQQFGRCAYLFTALKHIRGHRFSAAVTLDDNPPIHVLAKSILVANMGQLLPGINLFAQSSPSDGIIEIGLLKASRLQHFLQLIAHLLFGRADQDSSFDTYQARRVHIETAHHQLFELDGEPQPRLKVVTMQVVPGAATIMLRRRE